eukprot:951458-Pyramimonas_sp.AAC.1
MYVGTVAAPIAPAHTSVVVSVRSDSPRAWLSELRWKRHPGCRTGRPRRKSLGGGRAGRHPGASYA